MSDANTAGHPLKRAASDLARLIRDFLDGKLAPPPPLPDGARLDPSYGETIAADGGLLDVSRAYWTRELARWGEAAQFFDGRAGRLATASAATPSRAVLGAAKRLRTDEEYLLDNPPHQEKLQIVRVELFPLLSVDEIAQHIYRTSPTRLPSASADDLLRDLDALLSSTPGQPAADVPAAARGMRAARELVDVAKRFRFACDNYSTALGEVANASFSELLALHWVEGAFAVAPSWDSFSAGPLILALPRTTPGDDPDDRNLLDRSAYRTGRVYVFDTGLIRPGFIPYHPWDPAFANSPNHGRVDAINTNEMALGGLDNVIVWMPCGAEPNRRNRTPRTNELWAILESSGAGDNRRFYGDCLAALEARTSVPTAQALIDDGLAINHATIERCVSDRVPSGPAPTQYVVLKADDESLPTRVGLQAAARWYRSRRMVRTLLAWRDRSAIPQGTYLTPYLTYLRYHTGDVLFMRTIITVIKALPALKGSWERLLRVPAAKRRYDEAGANLLTRLTASGASDAATLAALAASAEDWDRFWHGRTVYDVHKPKNAPADWLPFETTWRHVGLAAAIRSVDPHPPSWLPSMVVDAGLDQAATTARDCVKAITDLALWPVVDAALQYTPIDTLIQAKVTSTGDRAGRSRFGFVAQLAKAENFERRRLYYEVVRQKAGLNEAGM